MSRSRCAKLIQEGHVTVGGKTRKPSYLVKPNDEIVLVLPEPKVMELVAQDIPLDIVYEDAHMIVVNKQRGLVVHPAPGHPDGTLVNALLYHCQDIAGIGGEMRPGIIHRIDKDTTGLLVVAKNDAAMESLSDQIAVRTMHRHYQALVEGSLKEGGTIQAPIGRSLHDRKKMAVVQGGRDATTHYHVQQRYKHHALLDIALETGRTHQIRVHMTYISHPVVGDPVYGVKKQRFNLEGQLLHAYALELTHPVSGERMRFQAPLPADFQHVLHVLEPTLVE